MTSVRADVDRLASPQPGATGLARAALFLFAAGLPLDVVLATRLGSASAALGIPLALAGAWQVLSSGRVRRLAPALVWVVAFTVWSALSIFWARDVAAFDVQVATRAQLLAFVLLTWQIARSQRDVDALLAGFLVGCFVTVAEVWRAYMFLGEVGERGIGRWAGDTLDPNDMATTLAIGIPVAGFFSLRRARRWHVLALAYLPLALSGIALSASRGGAITAAAGGAWLLAAAWRRRQIQFASLVLVLGIGIAAGSQAIPTESLTRIVSIRHEVREGTLGDRLQIWRAGLEVLERHPVAGVGTGGFKGSVAPALNVRVAAHNTPLSIAVELGAIGLALFVGTLGSSLVSLARAPAVARWLGWGLVLTWGIGSSSLSWDYNKTTWFVVLVCAALGAASRERRSSEDGAPDPAGRNPRS